MYARPSVMLAHFVTVFTCAVTLVFVVGLAPVCCSTTVSTSAVAAPDHESAEPILPTPVHYCDNSHQCLATYGYSRCDNHLCLCDQNFYQVYNRTSGKTYCQLCSQFQESCASTQCCQNPQATRCFNDMCVCKPGMDEECLGRYTPSLGIQLANTLSVSFAFVFLAITFIAVIRKTLFRCSFCRFESMSRTASDSSLNEFVKQKMQNRPPCYDDIEKDLKVPIDTNQPPPAYSAKHCGRMNTFRSALNRAFSISDEVELNTAPPNYSTFTTVTNVAVASPDRRLVDNEIILTQPIYMNNNGSLERRMS